MRVCLIAPPTVRLRYNISGVYPLPPLGLAYIAAILEEEGFGVEIIDMPALKMNIAALDKYLRGKDAFTVYGLSCNAFNLKDGLLLARLIKQVNPKATVVIGGRCSGLPADKIFRYGRDFDVIVNGEGEHSMLELCRNIRDGLAAGSFKGIRGLSFRQNGNIVSTDPMPYADLDTLPFPARHLLPNTRYRMHPPFGIFPPVTLMETSRGCVYNCSFCGLSSPVRERSVDHILSEVKHLISYYGVKEIHFVDPTFTFNQSRIKELCSQICARGLKFSWTCKTRVDCVSVSLLCHMHKAGCYMISYGVESGSQSILDSLKKSIRLENTANAFQWTRSAHMRTIAYAIIGYPNEQEADIQSTIKLIHKLNPDFVLYNEFFLVPGSNMEKEYMREQRIDFDDLIEFYSRGAKNTVIDRHRVTRQLKTANRLFYTRPVYILSRLASIKNCNDFMVMFKGVFHMLIDKIRARSIF
ncbi:MAG: radical SAM protein [Candidatus Omnitrophota bacterium]